MANNDALDDGRGGQTETVAALARAGLRHTGLPGQIAHLRVASVR
ncbi:MAG: capsular biosynthesis protein, partial [Thermoleophilia bacterium]